MKIKPEKYPSKTAKTSKKTAKKPKTDPLAKTSIKLVNYIEGPDQSKTSPGDGAVVRFSFGDGKNDIVAEFTAFKNGKIAIRLRAARCFGQSISVQPVSHGEIYVSSQSENDP